MKLDRFTVGGIRRGDEQADRIEFARIEVVSKDYKKDEDISIESRERPRRVPVSRRKDEAARQTGRASSFRGARASREALPGLTLTRHGCLKLSPRVGETSSTRRETYRDRGMSHQRR